MQTFSPAFLPSSWAGRGWVAQSLQAWWRGSWRARSLSAPQLPLQGSILGSLFCREALGCVPARQPAKKPRGFPSLWSHRPQTPRRDDTELKLEGTHKQPPTPSFTYIFNWISLVFNSKNSFKIIPGFHKKYTIHNTQNKKSKSMHAESRNWEGKKYKAAPANS